MNPKKTIRQLLEEKDNDYSKYEPFDNPAPIPSSIIIPVYNSTRTLEKTLSNLSQQRSILTNPDLFEIIIVDDDSDEDICSVFKNSFFECDKYFVRHDKNLGRSSARNSGIKKANKELVFFFDADVLLPSNYLEKMWSIHNSLNNTIAVGLAQNIYSDQSAFNITDPSQIKPDITDDFRYYKKFKDLQFGGREFRLMEETNWLKQFGHHKRIGSWTLPKMVVTHNISVRKDNVLKVDGFDERFRTWGYEDTYFGAKLIASGCYVIPSKDTGILRIIQSDKKKKFSNENKLLYQQLINTIE